MGINVIRGNTLAQLACDNYINLFFLHMPKFLQPRAWPRAACWKPAPVTVSYLLFLSVAERLAVELQNKSLGSFPSNLLILLLCHCCYCSSPSEIPALRDQLTPMWLLPAGPIPALKTGCALSRLTRSRMAASVWHLQKLGPFGPLLVSLHAVARSEMRCHHSPPACDNSNSSSHRTTRGFAVSQIQTQRVLGMRSFSTLVQSIPCLLFLVPRETTSQDGWARTSILCWENLSPHVPACGFIPLF